MKRKFLAALLALVMVFSMIPVSASAEEATDTDNGVTFEYGNSLLPKGTFTVTVLAPDGTQYSQITVSDFSKSDSHSNTLTINNDKYEIASISLSDGVLSSHKISDNKQSVEFICTFTQDSSTLTVQLAEHFEESQVIIEGEEIKHNGIFYYDISEVEALKMVGKSLDWQLPDSITIDGITLRYVQTNVLQPTEDFHKLDGYYENGYIDYWDADAQNGSELATPYNIRQIEIHYNDTETAIIPYTDLKYVRVANRTSRYEIQSNDASHSIVAFYNEAESATGNDYSLYAVRFVETGNCIGESKMPPDPKYDNHLYYEFTGWTIGYNGGAPFHENTTVTDDTVVYAQKKTTTSTSSEIHVMNENGELINRYIELFNASHPDSSITAESIDMGSIKITVYGQGDEHTNPDYTIGLSENGWRDNNSYYFVYNYLTGVGEQENIPIAVNEITKIVIDAKDTNGNTLDPVTINRGSANGEFDATTGAGGASGYIIELYIKAAPTAPTDDDLLDDPDIGGDLAILGENAVKVTCTNSEVEHEAETYGLIANTNGQNDSYTIGAVTALAGGGYTCTITVHNGPYVTKYGGDHTLAENESASHDIVLTWDSDSNTWNAPSTLPVNFNVICDTEPGGGPEAPNLSDVKIYVACTNAEHSASSSYSLIDGSYRGTMSENGGVYTYSVTVSADKYVSRFSTDSGTLHKLDSDYSYSDTLTIVYTYNGSGWDTTDRGNVFFVTCAESGEEQPTPPSITPEDVITLMGDNAIKVVCETEGSEHNPSSYRLIPGSFDVGKVTKGEDGKYSCVITIDEDGILQYVDAYDMAVGSEHTAISRGPITFTITYDGIKWLQPELPAATITVACEADQEDELDEDDLNEILGGAITVQCVSEEDHGYKTLTLYELLENASLGDASLENIYSFIKNADGTYTVTLDGEKFASAYGTYVSGKIGMGENIPHQLVNEEDAAFEITLTHDGIKWTFDPDPIVIKVTCEDDSGEEPVEPTPTPTPDPTPTPGPGGGDNPPYIPPVDPDDSGVSDLLNTDDHIQYLFGYPEGTFGPENNMTRAEVAQMFYNLLLDQDVTITKTFDDVPANAWYAKAVNTLASLGVVSGVGNGDFEPERSITRAEFTSIAMKFAEGKTGGTNIFSDVKSTDWFYRAVVNSTQYGWIHGYGDGTFRPNNPITRVEVTAIVNNMLGREADVDFVTEHYDELNHFSDLAVSHWGYYHIVEATNDHDYTKPSSGENWTELN